MSIDETIKKVNDLKHIKKQKEVEIENIKSNIIITKNDFYKKQDNYSIVESKFKELDNLFMSKSDTSINVLDRQLFNIIIKVFDKIISKKTDLGVSIKGRYEDINLGLNSKGIGELRKTWGYGRSNDDTRLRVIENLETYIKILKDKAIVEKIKANIHKQEKKNMLDVLHTYLQNWLDTLAINKKITINRDIYIQYQIDQNYTKNLWDINFEKSNIKEIHISGKQNSDWANGQYINKKYVEFKITNATHNGQDIIFYSIYKPDNYSYFDINDTYFIGCQLWDIIGNRIDEVINMIKNEQKIKMEILKGIWDKVSPYLMVDAI